MSNQHCRDIPLFFATPEHHPQNHAQHDDYCNQHYPGDLHHMGELPIPEFIVATQAFGMELELARVCSIEPSESLSHSLDSAISIGNPLFFDRHHFLPHLQLCIRTLCCGEFGPFFLGHWWNTSSA